MPEVAKKKRGRGRPRKKPENGTPQKRGRGRPRKSESPLSPSIYEPDQDAKKPGRPQSEGHLRQLTFEFDYESIGLAASESRLEEIADVIDETYAAFRSDSIAAAIIIASSIAKAKIEFKKSDEKNWAKWTKARLQMSAPTANKAIAVHEVFGKFRIEDLAGLPSSKLPKLARKEFAAERKKILALAKQKYLSEQEVEAMLGSGNGQASFGVTTPHDHDELKAYIHKKIDGLVKRLDDDLVEELPEVLRELAAEFNGK